MTYSKQRADDGEDNDREDGHDDAVDDVRHCSLGPPKALGLAYHVHAFIADTTGFMMAADRRGGLTGARFRWRRRGYRIRSTAARIFCQGWLSSFSTRLM